MTAQLHEKLILNGEETSMLSCPSFPEGNPRICKINDESALDSLSTGCRRGYQGTWEIVNGRFYLNELRGAFRLRENAPIFAEWFTGVLQVPKGKILEPVQLSLNAVYEQELEINIESGVVAGTRMIDNRRRMRG